MSSESYPGYTGRVLEIALLGEGEGEESDKAADELRLSLRVFTGGSVEMGRATLNLRHVKVMDLEKSMDRHILRR